MPRTTCVKRGRTVLHVVAACLTGLRTVHLRARLGNVKTDYRCGSTSETAVACSLTHQCMFTQAANQECPPRIPIRRARQR